MQKKHVRMVGFEEPSTLRITALTFLPSCCVKLNYEHNVHLAEFDKFLEKHCPVFTFQIPTYLFNLGALKQLVRVNSVQQSFDDLK